MADYPLRRQPEYFVVHPTSSTAMIMEDYCASTAQYRSSTLSANAIPVSPPSEIVQLKPGKKTPDPAATIQDLIDEPLFWRGYTSDEEVASPLVDDNRSFDSSSFCYDSEDVVSVRNAPSPQESTRSLDKSKQQVTQAHAVQFLSAGKAKVVSMPTSCTIRTAPSSPTRVPMSKTSRMNIQGRAINFSRTTTPKASCEINSSVSDLQTYEGSSYPQRVVRRKPDVPALQAVSRSQSPFHGDSTFITPRSARRAGLVEPDESPVASHLAEAAWFSQSNTPEEERPSSQVKRSKLCSLDSNPESYPAQEASPVPDSPPFSLLQKRSGNYILQGSSSARRPAVFTDSMTQDTYTFPESPSLSRPRLLRKLSSTFSFKTFTWPSRQDSFSSNDSEKLQPVQEISSKPAHAISDMHVPSRTSSKPPPKMVPRGGNERAPPIVIPPCPNDYDDEDLPARWPQMMETVSKHDKVAKAASSDDLAIDKAETKVPTAHQRKKSHSTSSGSGSS